MKPLLELYIVGNIVGNINILTLTVIVVGPFKLEGLLRVLLRRPVLILLNVYLQEQHIIEIVSSKTILYGRYVIK